MRNIDYKSLIIGILGTIISFLLIGATNQKFVSDELICKKLVIINDKNKERIILTTNNDGGKFQIMNKYGELANSLGVSESGSGYFSSYNNYGVPTFSAGTGSNGNGIIKTFNKDGNVRTYIGSADSGGLFSIYNNWDIQIGFLGASKKQDGYIKLSNQYGEKGWEESGVIN
tara:strand:+ start:484 stop:999 length:516 start_codon:yes stop_codon:yes gene_type:complete